MWLQGNKLADDVGGFIDIILTQALSMANSIPDITNPLAVIGTFLPGTNPLSYQLSYAAQA